MSTAMYWFVGITLLIIALAWLFAYTERKRWDWEDSE